MESLRTLLKREESYAIHALIGVAEHPGTTAAEIAERLDAPYPFLAKVLRKLVTTGFIESQMGRNGGVTLLREPARITLLEVIEAVSGTLLLDTCQARRRCATERRKGYCKLNVAMLGATVTIRELLAGITLEQLCDLPDR